MPQLAIKYGISLIFWGANPALTANDNNTNNLDPYDGNNLRNANTVKKNILSWDRFLNLTNKK